MMEVSLANQQTAAAMESDLVSKMPTKIVNLDLMKDFQECMNTNKICNGYNHSIQLLWLLHFMNPPVMFVLL